MRWIGGFLIIAGGCEFSSPSAAPADAGTDGGSLCVPWDSLAHHVTPCDVPPRPSWTVTAPGGTFDTTDGTYDAGGQPESAIVTQRDGSMLRVVSVDSFTVGPGATLRVIGAHPLLVLSWSTIRISGTVDASSVRSDSRLEKGAGADRLGCPPAQAGQGYAGGGGGGLGAGGGPGGDDGLSSGGGGAGSIGKPRIVLGGCRGAEGGAASSAGAGGAGGGGIQLTARQSIEIAAGRIHAGGAGGQGAHGDGGGGGGGSGGFIGLDAPVVTVAGGLLAANGGGGGTGCTGGDGHSGANGALGTARAPGGPSDGCQNATAGGRGGAGGDLSGEGGESSTQNGGDGGGGGGGVGYILVWSPAMSFQGTTSPVHVRMPF